TTMAGLTLRVRRHERLTLVAAHLTFIILNFATMPFWQMEGLALYGVLCGYTLFSARSAVVERGAARPPRRQWNGQRGQRSVRAI
ncbi:MAG: hypothetical protein JJE34_10695, partial [Alphaproteobacteria bacterium]|nr:hypothetical protein [Alphaproteobacteria bacterium]